MAKYKLQCLHPDCNQTYVNDTDFRLQCEGEKNKKHSPAFLRPIYEKEQIDVYPKLPGIFKYVDWLPTGPYFLNIGEHTLGEPVCYKSKGLAKCFELKNLYIAFSGFWPHKGGNLITRTFKEFEAQGTLGRYLSIYQFRDVLPFIISSAGNTANGFNLLSHILDMPLYLIIPESGIAMLQLPFKTRPYLIVVRGDYSDAIKLADNIASETGLMQEGGARNVARRAGMGTVMLNAVLHPEHGTKFLFDHYFQAVGSGTGAIAAWEAVNLLLNDGRFGNTVTKIHMAQNSPFTPIADSWENERQEFQTYPEDIAKEKISSVTAPVLSNRNPPYSIAGGIYDVLKTSGGNAWKVDNSHLYQAAYMFRQTEGVHISSAAAVAVDALKQAVLTGKVKREDRVLLHITGGGADIKHINGKTYQVHPDIVIKPNEVDKVLDKIGKAVPISNSRNHLKKYNN